MDDLMTLELVVRVQDGAEEGRLQPAAAPETMTVTEVLKLLRDRRGDGSLPVATPVWIQAKALETRLRIV